MSSAKVVILNWNGAHHLRRFLPSVVASTPADVGIVVADNGSTDNSVEVIKCEFPTVELISLERNYGFAEGYNRAMQHIESDYAILLNSDVETPNGWVTPLIDHLDNNPDVAVVAPKLLAEQQRSKFEYAGAAGGFIDMFGYPFCRGRILNHTEEDKGQYDDAHDIFWASGAAFCCRTDVFKELGGFDGDFFAHMEEIDLCWRMQLAGWRIRIEPRSKVYHLGGGTLSSTSPMKIFYNHRNNLMMLYKCSSPAQRLLVAVARPILDTMAALSYLASGNTQGFKAVFRAWRNFLAAHHTLAAKRHAIRSRCKSKPHTIYHGSILLRYLLGLRSYTKL